MTSEQRASPEKQVVSTAVQPVPSLSNSDEEEGVHQRPSHDLKKAIWAIVTGVALPCIPILVIVAVLLAFILVHKIDPWSGYPELALNITTESNRGLEANVYDFRHNGGAAAYLVDYNPSTLTTIASWTSRIIPYLTSSIMALVAFFAARYIVQQSKKGDQAVLPDPEQLTILIGLLGGNSVTPLKDTLFYRWLKKERLVSPVPAVFWVLAFITALGLIIPLIDTWFGIATHAVSLTVLSNTTKAETYGRQLDRYGPSANCPSGPQGNISDAWITETFWPCSVQVAAGASNHLLLAGSLTTTRLQYGVPTSTTISNYTDGSNNWFFYTDPRADTKLDFLTTSPALSTTCIPMTHRCLANIQEGGQFQCSRGFRGNIYRTWPSILGNETMPDDTTSFSLTGIAFAGDAELNIIPNLVNSTTPGGYPGPSWPEILPRNPTHFGTWAVNYPSYTNTPESLGNDPEFQFSAAGNLWFLNCSTTVVNATYAWSNGTLHSFRTDVASPEMAALFLGQFSVYGLTEDFKTAMDYTLASIANLASLSGDMEQLSLSWATGFSKAAVARTVGAFAPSTNEIEQQREAGVVVARVPLIPLYLLIGIKLIYVVAVIVLAIGAYAFTHPAETELVKAQLSTKGLAAAHFDQPGLLQDNAVKAVQERLDIVGEKGRSNTEPQQSGTTKGTEPQPGQLKLKRSETSPADIEGGKPKVGLVPNAEGAWNFVVMANGAWHSISPIVKSVVLNEAKQGDLGAVGGVINAWKG